MKRVKPQKKKVYKYRLHYFDWDGEEDVTACGIIIDKHPMTTWVTDKKKVTCPKCLKKIKK